MVRYADPRGFAQLVRSVENFVCRVGRVATFLPLLLILSASTSNADITLKAYLDLRESPQVREKLRTYFTGVGRGIFWSNAVLNARGAQPLFCMPDKLALDEGIIQSVLDQEIRAPSEGSPYTGDTPVTDYAVGERGQSERALWGPALDRHIALFDRAPQLAVADGGFASRANERAAQDRGVRHVVLPRQSREKRSRIARAALRWRTGSEGRISALKRRHGLRRCRYRGEGGMQRWVGLGVIANNLLVLGRAGP